MTNTAKGRPGAPTPSGQRRKSAGSGSFRQRQYDTPESVRQPSHGKVRGNVWHKCVIKSRHMMRRPTPGWAVDLVDLARAEALGAEWLDLHESEQGVTYRVKLAMFRTHGRKIDYVGKQLHLPKGYFATLEGNAPEPEPTNPLQPALFGA